MKKILVLIPVLLLCLGLAACGDTDSDDTQLGYETVMDMEFLGHVEHRRHLEAVL